MTPAFAAYVKSFDGRLSDDRKGGIHIKISIERDVQTCRGKRVTQRGIVSSEENTDGHVTDELH